MKYTLFPFPLLQIVDCSLRLYLRSDIVYASITRVNKLKLVPQHCKYDLRKHYFTNRVVSIWNSLPNDVAMADNINLFKNHLNSFIHSFIVFIKTSDKTQMKLQE